MSRIEEVEAKLDRVRALMAAEELGAVVLGGQANFAWITAGGDSHVVMGAEQVMKRATKAAKRQVDPDAKDLKQAIDGAAKS